jgi:Ca2+/Na+ antiporter
MKKDFTFQYLDFTSVFSKFEAKKRCVKQKSGVCVSLCMCIMYYKCMKGSAGPGDPVCVCVCVCVYVYVYYKYERVCWTWRPVCVLQV